MNTYTRIGVVDQAAAVELLPPLPTGKKIQVVEAKATGTDGPIPPKPRPRKVPTMVPRGAQNGAVQLASGTSQAASDCTETADSGEAEEAMQNAASSKVVGACGVDLHRDASSCITKCERQDLNLHPLRDWILSPARLPIPPLSQPYVVTTCAYAHCRLSARTTGLRHEAVAAATNSTTQANSAPPAPVHLYFPTQNRLKIRSSRSSV